MIFIHFKRFIIWTIITFLFGVFVSLAFLFSRDLTLNTVKLKEFQIYYSFLDKKKNYDSTEIQSHFNLLLSKKKYPLLPIAIISKDSCLENVLPYYNKRFNLSICNKINFSDLNSIDKKNIFNYYGDTIIEFNGKSYIFKKLTLTEKWLVGSVNNYYKLNDFNRFIQYITDNQEGLSWLSSIKSFKVFIYKSKFIWMIIIPFSILLYILFTLFYLKHTNKLKDLQKEKNKYLKEWDSLNTKTKKLIIEQTKLDQELHKKTILLEQNKVSSEEINILKDKNSNLLENIEQYIKELKILEQKEKNVAKQLSEISKKLTNAEKEKLIQENNKKIENIDQLWNYTPKWKERQQIENNVALRNKVTPFTISQAFICFEKVIENLVIKDNQENKNLTLHEQITYIFDHALLPINFENDLHQIRKARNLWFHSGQEPTSNTFDILLDMLDKTNTKPIL